MFWLVVAMTTTVVVHKVRCCCCCAATCSTLEVAAMWEVLLVKIGLSYNLFCDLPSWISGLKRMNTSWPSRLFKTSTLIQTGLYQSAALAAYYTSGVIITHRRTQLLFSMHSVCIHYKIDGQPSHCLHYFHANLLIKCYQVFFSFSCVIHFLN